MSPARDVFGSIVDRDQVPLPRGTWRIFGLAFVGFATPVIGFVELAERVRGNAPLSFDRPLMLWIRRRHSPRRTRLVRAVTELGGVTAVPVVALSVAGYLAAVRGSRRPAALLTVSLVGSTVINSVLKVMYRRTRPTFFAHIVQEKSYSFPSGHAMASAALAGCACVLAWVGEVATIMWLMDRFDTIGGSR